MKTPLFYSIIFIAAFICSEVFAQKKGKDLTPSNDSVKIFQALLEKGDSAAWMRLRTETRRTDTSDRIPNRASIKAFARSYDDSIILRWAPTKPGAWVTANRIGYVIERFTYTGDRTIEKASKKKLNSTPIKPWTEAEWKARVKDKNKFAAISA